MGNKNIIITLLIKHSLLLINMIRDEPSLSFNKESLVSRLDLLELSSLFLFTDLDLQLFPNTDTHPITSGDLGCEEPVSSREDGL